MTLDIDKQCATCAWRGACAKKHTIRETMLHCPDYSRDRALGPETEAAGPVERHKRTEDVFGSRR